MVETARLPEAERAALERLVRASGFFALPGAGAAGGVGGAAGGRGPAEGRPRPMPDALQYDIEIEDEGRTHRVRLPEQATGPELRDLVDRVWDAPPAAEADA